MDKNKDLITKRKIFGFSTVITLNLKLGDIYITDGKVNDNSPLINHFKDSVTGQRAFLIEECTYAIYTNGERVIIEARENVSNFTIAKILRENIKTPAIDRLVRELEDNASAYYPAL